MLKWPCVAIIIATKKDTKLKDLKKNVVLAILEQSINTSSTMHRARVKKKVRKKKCP